MRPVAPTLERPAAPPGWHVAWRAPLLGAAAGAGIGAAFGVALLAVLAVIGSVEQLLAGVPAGDALDDLAVVVVAMGYGLAFGAMLGLAVGGGAGLAAGIAGLAWAVSGRPPDSRGARAVLIAAAIGAAAALVFLVIPEGHRPVQHLVLADPALDLAVSVLLLRAAPLALAIWGAPLVAGWVLRPWARPASERSAVAAS